MIANTMMRSLLGLIALLLCVSAATVPSRTENRGIQARSNAEAMARGLPLVRPRNIPDTIQGRYNGAYLTEFKRRQTERQAMRRQAAANPSGTPLPGVGTSNSFEASCTGATLAGTTLSATCLDAVTGVSAVSTIDLNTCYGASGGALTCGLTGFSTPCDASTCTLVGTTLKCSCSDTSTTPAGGPYLTASDIGGCVGNNEGVLYCDHTYTA
ncbi:hypothetical protein JCM24511_00106 [Saitozyma sp. JCM 24511]|nr:hypothetical protein JCM24511_00106 [Saitozyma sp. JCM 24511]